MGTSATLGDRMAQMEAMDGAARCLETLRLQNKICNCRPLEFNTRLLEVASSIGAKVLPCHSYHTHTHTVKDNMWYTVELFLNFSCLSEKFAVAWLWFTAPWATRISAILISDWRIRQTRLWVWLAVHVAMYSDCSQQVWKHYHVRIYFTPGKELMLKFIRFTE